MKFIDRFDCFICSNDVGQVDAFNQDVVNISCKKLKLKTSIPEIYDIFKEKYGASLSSICLLSDCKLLITTPDYSKLTEAEFTVTDKEVFESFKSYIFAQATFVLSGINCDLDKRRLHSQPMNKAKVRNKQKLAEIIRKAFAKVYNGRI